jgi:putative AdoMet-dependent methyltransferase
MTKDFFAPKAGSYEQNPNRVNNVDNIARAIVDAVKLEKTMQIMDFGSGTGLLLERISPYVGKVTAVDTSGSMNAQLQLKIEKLGCEVEIIEIDLERESMPRIFDGIISSMTLHHIRDIDALFRTFYAMLTPGGFIAISDLDTEDGSFHTEDTGVHHCGFERDDIAQAAAQAGFTKVEVSNASVVIKPQGEYPVFLLTAFR